MGLWNRWGRHIPVSRLISSALAAVMEHSSSSTLQGAQAVGAVALQRNKAGFAKCAGQSQSNTLRNPTGRRGRALLQTVVVFFSSGEIADARFSCLAFNTQLLFRACSHEGIHSFQRSIFSAQMAGGLQNTLGRHGSIILSLCQSQRLLFLLWKEH